MKQVVRNKKKKRRTIQLNSSLFLLPGFVVEIADKTKRATCDDSVFFKVLLTHNRCGQYQQQRIQFVFPTHFANITNPSLCPLAIQHIPPPSQPRGNAPTITNPSHSSWAHSLDVLWYHLFVVFFLLQKQPQSTFPIFPLLYSSPRIGCFLLQLLTRFFQWVLLYKRDKPISPLPFIKFYSQFPPSFQRVLV